MTKVNRWADDVDAGKGALSVLLRDEQAAKDMKATLSNLEAITRKASEGEGLVAKLLSDPKTSEKFDRILDGFERCPRGSATRRGASRSS